MKIPHIIFIFHSPLFSGIISIIYITSLSHWCTKERKRDLNLEFVTFISSKSLNTLMMAVVKKGMQAKLWMEVAPSRIISPEKPSCMPQLETIREERSEDYEDDNDQN